MNLAQAILEIYPDADPFNDFRVICHDKTEQVGTEPFHTGIFEEVGTGVFEKRIAITPDGEEKEVDVEITEPREIVEERPVYRVTDYNVQEIEYWNLPQPQPTAKQLQDAWAKRQARIEAGVLDAEEADAKLAEIDQKKIRAITDAVLTGDTSTLADLEQQSANIRSKRYKKGS